jgi:hypothetical protein
VSPVDATGWRDFWRGRGEQELTTLLREVWGPLAAAEREVVQSHATRVATLLGSRAPDRAVASELGRMRDGLRAQPDPDGDAAAAARLVAWFDEARRT